LQVRGLFRSVAKSRQEAEHPVGRGALRMSMTRGLWILARITSRARRRRMPGSSNRRYCPRRASHAAGWEAAEHPEEAACGGEVSDINAQLEARSTLGR
jgi:hypothetical protein